MKKRLIPASILVAYSAILIKVMVLKDVPVIRIGSLLMLNFGGTDANDQANFVPFKTILPYLLGETGLIAIVNLVGNIALLVPIGFLAPFVHRKMTWQKSLALAVAVGLAIEGMQMVFRVGIVDIDDVILNALGVMIGYWVFTVFVRWLAASH